METNIHAPAGTVWNGYEFIPYAVAVLECRCGTVTREYLWTLAESLTEACKEGEEDAKMALKELLEII